MAVLYHMALYFSTMGNICTLCRRAGTNSCQFDLLAFAVYACLSPSSLFLSPSPPILHYYFFSHRRPDKTTVHLWSGITHLTSSSTLTRCTALARKIPEALHFKDANIYSCGCTSIIKWVKLCFYEVYATININRHGWIVVDFLWLGMQNSL